MGKIQETRIGMRIDKDFYKEAKAYSQKRRFANFSEYIRSLIRQDLQNAK